LHLLVLDTDNPRSLGWVARTMRERFLKLARHEAAWAQSVALPLPRPETWALETLSDVASDAGRAALVSALHACSRDALGLSDAISRRLFSHVGPVDRMVWQ
jgi:uncharacterized alpha-E superfamily protein